MHLLTSPFRRIWTQTKRNLGFIYGIGNHGSPSSVLHFDGGIGDQLLLTCPARELARRGEPCVWVCSRYPELFAGNSSIRHVVPKLSKGVGRRLRAVEGKIITPSYVSHIHGERRDLPPTKHILAIMCEQAGVRGDVELRPYLHLSPDDLLHKHRVDRQIIIQSTGMSARYSMSTKEWFPERFQQVVSSLRKHYQFVQVGSIGDPKLEGALDLRGKTTIRETAALLHRSVLFVGLVGFLMHLARAVDCRAVIVYGGRELPSQSGYPCNVNLTGQTACSPCWRYDDCAGQRACMKQITAAQVIEAISIASDSSRHVLQTEHWTL